ncbi:MAG: MASE1 domain-containing protein [Pseudolabrys sp.]|nr:MASE1 domain-containing protein [Pseudolabrys sp.]
MSDSGLERRPVAMAFPRIFKLPQPVLAFSFLAGYVLLDWVSFIHPFAPFGITPWNPPTGLSFILILLFGQRFIPLLFAAPLLADILVRQLPLSWTVEFITSATIGGFYATGLLILLRPAMRFNPALTSMRDLVMLIIVAAVSSAFVAMSYVGVLVAAQWLPAEDFTQAALQYWIGDIIGIAVVAPFALIALTRGRALALSRETALQVFSIVAALAIVFLYSETHRFELFYILFLPVIWMAVRGGLELVTIGILITQIGLIVCMQLLPSLNQDIAAFQALMLVMALTGLAAGAVVTEHRRTEFQLRLHQDSLAHVARRGSLGELAAMVAHEINQPLMAAGTYTRLVADTLRAPGGDGALAAETAEKAAAQVQRAADVVRQLRALIRLDQSGRAPVGVDRIVRETLDLCRPELDRHAVSVRTALDGDLPSITVDLLQIEQVLLNLIRNATEAMQSVGHGGMIVIKASRVDNEEVAIEVVDIGPGFPAEFSGANFPPLSSSKAEGLGVGLSLCRSIVEAHGGRLTASGGSGGATVRFTLPVAQA